MVPCKIDGTMRKPCLGGLSSLLLIRRHAFPQKSPTCVASSAGKLSMAFENVTSTHMTRTAFAYWLETTSNPPHSTLLLYRTSSEYQHGEFPRTATCAHGRRSTTIVTAGKTNLNAETQTDRNPRSVCRVPEEKVEMRWPTSVLYMLHSERHELCLRIGTK
jgi:hypothetical protein